MSDRNCRVAIFCRLAQEDDLGMRAQQTTMCAFAESLGFQEYAEYADNGYSGRTLERPAFVEMMKEVQAGNIQTIVVRNISRISRDLILFHNWMGQIQAKDITVVSMQENICRDYLNRIGTS